MIPQKVPVEADRFIDSFIGLEVGQFNIFASCCSPGIPFQDASEHLLKWIRRRAIRRTEYTGPVSPESRTRREGQPWSWVEKRIIEFAFSKPDSETPKGVEITEEYIANLLQRSINEVRDERYTKNGIRGFDLWPQ